MTWFSCDLGLQWLLVVAHVEEVPRRARHVLRDGGKVHVRDPLLLAKLPV